MLKALGKTNFVHALTRSFSDVICQSCGYVKVNDLYREFKKPFGFCMFRLFLFKNRYSPLQSLSSGC